MTHGDMSVYECDIPEGTLSAGTNTVTLGVTSSKSGSEWLSPNYVSKYSLLSLVHSLLSDHLQILDFIELYY